MSTFLLVVVAVGLTVLVPWLSRRRVVCPMSATLGLAAGLAWLLVSLTGCSSPAAEDPAAAVRSADASVQWSDYSPTVRQRIDAAAASRQCTVLQAEFDQADANNEITRRRTGHGNAELMGYIDAQLRAAGCYGSSSAT